MRGERHEILNYQYRNQFRLQRLRASAALYRRVGPGALLSGHWEPRWVDEGYLDYLGSTPAWIWWRCTRRCCRSTSSTSAPTACSPGSPRTAPRLPQTRSLC